jgi:hypothetical protein
MFLDHGGWVCDIFDLLKSKIFDFIFKVNMIEIMMFIYSSLVHCEIGLNHIW